MIYWKDFIFDDVLGPILMFEDEGISAHTNEKVVSKEHGNSAGVMEDATGIQETNQSRLPTRKSQDGFDVQDGQRKQQNKSSDAITETGTEAGCGDHMQLRQREG